MFIKYHQTQEARNLHGNMAANHLLSIIAQRTQLKANPVEGVEKGEAKLGDFDKIGMTRQQYRTALENLERWGYITIRVTTKGTLAKLVNSEVYEVFNFDGNHQNNHQVTIEQPSNNHQVTIEQPSTNHQPTIKQPSTNHQPTIEQPLDKIIDNKIIDNKEESKKKDTPFLQSSDFEILQNQIAELAKQVLSLKTENKKEKNCGKKEKEKVGDTPPLTPPLTPPHKTDIEQPKLKPYQVAIHDFDFSIFSEGLKNAFFSFCESMHEKSKGKFSSTQAKELIRTLKIDIDKAGAERVEKCLRLCTLSGWNYDITYQLNKELRAKQDEIKRDKQHDDPTISTVESALRARFGGDFPKDEYQDGYTPLPKPWESIQEF